MIRPPEGGTPSKFLRISTLGENTDDVFFLSRLDGNTITAEVILAPLESNLVAELEARKAA